MLTAGGLAPCLSSAVGGLIERYTEVAPDVRLIAYKSGYAGLLTGDSVEVTDEVRSRAHLLHRFGGSPIGNSRVKLTNVKDCVRRGLVKEGQDPLHVAAEQLERDGVDVLHTIGGDDTNGTAADLAAYLHEHAYGDRRGPAQDDRQRHRAHPAVPRCLDGGGAGRPVRAQHRRRALVQPGCSWSTRSWGATAGGSRQQPPRRTTSGCADRSSPAGWRTTPGAGTSTRSTCPNGMPPIAAEADVCVPRWTSTTASTSSSRRAPGCRRSSRRWRLRARRSPGTLRPRPDRQDQPRSVVRQAVRRAARGRQGVGAEERLLLPFGRRERPGPRPHPEALHRLPSTRRCAASGAWWARTSAATRARAIEFDRIKGGKTFDTSTPWFVDLLEDLGQP